ncbi:MAG: GDSL family lipase [Lachnospiraceae bacterium]|nr:GDSL family lipase [Lachnospiraceae bacterium]
MRYYGIKDVKLKNHGRMDLTLDVIPMLSNGHGIELNVAASQLWVDLEADYKEFEPWAAIEINGDLVSRFMIDRGSQKVCLFAGRDPGRITRVKFYRELQAMSDGSGTSLIIRGLMTDGRILEPPVYDHKLEFIGDSISSGEGTYGARQDTDWIPAVMSYSRTYINLIGQALNAECRVISQGGWGVFSGWDNDRRHAIPRVYDKICGLASPSCDEYGAGKDHDFGSWMPEVILINLGTNDSEGFRQPPFTDPVTGEVYKLNTERDGTFLKEDVERIVSAAEGFLKKVRKNNPASHIVWMYGMLGYDLGAALSGAVLRYKRESGDDNVSYLKLPDTAEEDKGSNGHPGFDAHKKAAGVILDHLKEYVFGDSQREIT